MAAYTYTLSIYYHGNTSDEVTNLPQTQSTQRTAAPPQTLSITIPQNVPTRKGHTFLGYATSASGNVSKLPGDTVSSSFTQSSNQAKATSLYCIWQIKRYVISYDANGGNGAPSDQIKEYGIAITLSETVPTRQGYIFDGWNTSADGSGASYAPGDKYKSNKKATLYAQWREKVKTPTFTTQPEAYYSAPIGMTPRAITVLATSTWPVTYQWQSSSDKSTWSDISGATSYSYYPPTENAGTFYYRCVALSTDGLQTLSATSDVATVIVITSSAPIFLYDLSLIDVTYDAGAEASGINGTASRSSGTLSYQWQKSTDGGSTWFTISRATYPIYTPPTNIGGVSYYRAVATNTVGTSKTSSTSNAAKVTINNVVLTYDEKWSQYINSIGKPFVKLARLDFLNPNGSVLFSLDNNQNNPRSKAFIQDGEISVNLQNGMRRTATITLSNLDGEYDYSINKLWFGQQVQLWEGMILPNGSDFYISQGIFYIKDPDEIFEPGMKKTTLHLVDKWSYLDGTLFGNLDGTYEVPPNSNIFNAIQSILSLDRGNGQKVDSSIPVFTNYYNGKTTTLPDGSTVPLVNTPYTYRCDSVEGTYADIILELNTMLAGWIGYDANGQLRLDPSQDDILDTTKPVQWQFSPDNSTFLGATYSVKNSEVYNDIIIVGESLSDYGQTAGRATNYDPQSDTNANIIGLKTKRYQQSGYYTQDICESLAVFKLKRESVLKKSVSIRCSQMFHLQENNLVTIERTDKTGNPIERHLITGYTRPIAQTGEMVINATSVLDMPIATITTAP